MSAFSHAACSAVISLLAFDALQGAVPGTPEPPHPGPVPTLWAELGNDDLTIEGAENRSLDDHRTNELSLGVNISRSAVLMLDHSMLTDRLRMTRSDELTLTLGWLPLGSGEGDRPWIAVGGGMRFSGNLDGEGLQNRWHQLVALRTYRLIYDNDDEQAVGYACGAYPWWSGPNYGCEVTAAVLVTPLGEAQGDVAARAIIRSDSGQNRLWAGLRYRARSGRASGPTAEAVASFERGVWADVGWTLGFATLHALHDFDSGQSYGMIAVEWPR